MQWFPALLVGLLCFTTRVSPFDWPESIPRCSKDNPNVNKCLQNAVSKAINEIAAGNPQLSLPPLDPLELGSFYLGSDEGLVAIKFSFWNATYNGLGKTSVSDAKFNWKDRTLSMQLYNGMIDIEGQYKINGRLLFAPVYGSGPFKVNYYDMSTKHTVKLTPSRKDNRYVDAHYNLKKERLGDLNVRFENLFNGNANLGESINNAMNRNKKLMENAFTRPIENFLSQLVQKKLQPFFKKVPFDVMFPDHINEV